MLKILRKIVLILLLTLSLIPPESSYGQRHGTPNMPSYDNEKFHFGFVLGVNQCFLTLTPISDLTQRAWDSTYVPDILPLPDSAKILTLVAGSMPGFVISIVSDMKLGDYFNLRFIPSLSFGDRDLLYSIMTFDNGDTSIVNITKRVPSTYVNFPLELKYKAARYHNFRPYLLTGVQYTLDLASQAKKRERKAGGEKIVKFNQNDIYLEAGVGFDIYNEWFKFGVELKMMYGLMDILKREQNIYTNSIDQLKSKIFQISFTFE